MTSEEKVEMLRAALEHVAVCAECAQSEWEGCDGGLEAIAAFAATAEPSACSTCGKGFDENVYCSNAFHFVAPDARRAELLEAMEEAWDAGYNECALTLKGCAGMGRDWKLRNMLAALLEKP